MGKEEGILALKAMVRVMTITKLIAMEGDSEAEKVADKQRYLAQALSHHLGIGHAEYIYLTMPEVDKVLNSFKEGVEPEYTKEDHTKDIDFLVCFCMAT